MCVNCWNEYATASPVKTDRAVEAARLIRELHDLSCVGANFHIITDDWNLSTGHVQFCIDASAKNEFSYGADVLDIEGRLGPLLLGMPEHERAVALAITERFI